MSEQACFECGGDKELFKKSFKGWICFYCYRDKTASEMRSWKPKIKHTEDLDGWVKCKKHGVHFKVKDTIYGSAIGCMRCHLENKR